MAFLSDVHSLLPAGTVNSFQTRKVNSKAVDTVVELVPYGCSKVFKVSMFPHV